MLLTCDNRDESGYVFTFMIGDADPNTEYREQVARGEFG